jgi:hypothetical protein
MAQVFFRRPHPLRINGKAFAEQTATQHEGHALKRSQSTACLFPSNRKLSMIINAGLLYHNQHPRIANCVQIPCGISDAGLFS